MKKFTYGYIREATMAHLDLDENEAQAMDILKRFPVFANEAMQAICASKPKYEYVDVKAVKKFAPLVLDGANFSIANLQQVKELEDWLKTPADERPDITTLSCIFANLVQTAAYWHERHVYELGEKVPMETDFIAFANKQCYKYVVEPVKKIPEDCHYEYADYWQTNECKESWKPVRKLAKVDEDFSYVGRNQLKFYKEGDYLIPVKTLWHVFESGISDDEELNIPADILTCIPLYIAAICLQIDNPTRAQVKRSEFEMALARCTSTDFMENNEFRTTW